MPARKKRVVERVERLALVTRTELAEACDDLALALEALGQQIAKLDARDVDTHGLRNSLATAQLAANFIVTVVEQNAPAASPAKRPRTKSRRPRKGAR